MGNCYNVALLAEGVDRNSASGALRSTALVALLAEGVDRNSYFPELKPSPKGSPSSRRAWIEIENAKADMDATAESPSSRRAWIEIHRRQRKPRPSTVALLAEGVDRNLLF